ncbi:Fe-S cluster assembly protein SufD [Loktanella sp. PT4BL]|jgi:Fe-S cluster assembly protein SufD|uniref:SufB/SufD family protein n=1 Tax=Loktanella sp. PT4BL TaxID=2135611 RepID=UPI000D755768|nr:SufD family Fe-S cluster assembly protein [Loktanella sp. PT4BL]PXW70228.1 Fe-S cluster assembly protein SufD [Loktanella sp. PT4BL]
MALAQLKIDTTEARLADVDLPQGAAWGNAARADALARVRLMALPTKRDEYWKYTDPTSLTAVDAPEAALFASDEAPLFDAVDRVKIVFVDGVFDADASDDLEATGLEIERLSDAMATDIHWAKDIYGVLEAHGQKPVARPLAALNTALATDGVVIRVTGKATKPVNFIYLHNDTTSDAILHNVVKVEAGAEMTLLETGPAAARFSKLLEVEVAEGGKFNHVRAQGRDHERRAVTHCFARIAADSVFKSFTLTFNGVLTRNECVLELVGDDAVAHVAGVCVGDGKDFHHDDTVFITHDALNGESRQVFKKVLRNGATGVFQGKILVKEGAQKTDGYQISQSLLLDDDSQFLAKPELEIYADDVACSHGSTSGAIDETALFYLRSRGVPHDEARNLLTLSFLAEALEEIEDETLAEDLRDRLEGWLARHR